MKGCERIALKAHVANLATRLVKREALAVERFVGALDCSDGLA
jgi:hypothetical protein